MKRNNKQQWTRARCEIYLRNPLVELTEPGSLIPAVPDEVLEGLWRLVDAKETDVRLQEVVHCHGERMQPR